MAKFTYSFFDSLHFASTRQVESQTSSYLRLSIMATMLKFATLISDIELSFYTSLASHKINHDKLDDSARRLLGLYEIRASDSPESSCRLQVHGNALTNDTLVFPTDMAMCCYDTD